MTRPDCRLARSLLLHPLLLGALAILPASLMSSCASDPTQGYAHAWTYEGGGRTIEIVPFENQTFSHGLEARLTEAIVKEIERTTPWKVKSGGAETTLVGSIVRVDNRNLGTNRDSGLIQEYAVEIAIDFEWTDNSEDRVLVARRNFRGSGGFVPAFGAQERLHTGEQGAIEALARAIVADMRSDW